MKQIKMPKIRINGIVNIIADQFENSSPRSIFNILSINMLYQIDSYLRICKVTEMVLHVKQQLIYMC